MKYFMLIAAVVSFALTGCTPKLANRELGPEEQEWKEYIEEMYPGWEVPGTLPPAVAENDSKKQDAANADDDALTFSDDNSSLDIKNTNSSDQTISADKNDSLAASAAETEKNKVRYDEYTVEKDESLSIIAKKVYGNGRKYYRIYKANEDIIKNKNKIYPGMKLRIPRP